MYVILIMFLTCSTKRSVWDERKDFRKRTPSVLNLPTRGKISIGISSNFCSSYSASSSFNPASVQALMPAPVSAKSRGWSLHSGVVVGKYVHSAVLYKYQTGCSDLPVNYWKGSFVSFFGSCRKKSAFYGNYVGWHHGLSSRDARNDYKPWGWERMLLATIYRDLWTRMLMSY